MRVVEEILNLYRYEFIDEITRHSIQIHLNRCYPEAEWIVEVRLDTLAGIVATPKFKNPAEETFYKLKWS